MVKVLCRVKMCFGWFLSIFFPCCKMGFEAPIKSINLLLFDKVPPCSVYMLPHGTHIVCNDFKQPKETIVRHLQMSEHPESG